MKTGDVKPTVNQVKLLEQADGSGFERMEFTAHTTYNTPIVYGYKGISYYSSTSYVSVNELFGKLGLIHSNAWYVYRSAPPTLNSMFAVRYLLSQDGEYDNGIYREIDAAYSEETTGGAAAIPPPVRVYENPYFLPVGFMADESILSWNISQNNPFLCQEDFYKRASGINMPLFRKLAPRAERLENMTVTSGGGTDGVYRYRPAEVNRAVKASYRVTALRGGPVYFYVKCPKVEKVSVQNLTAFDRGDGEPAGISREHDIKYPYVIDAQFARPGDELQI
jgi:hypothetical protein